MKTYCIQTRKTLLIVKYGNTNYSSPKKVGAWETFFSRK